MNIEIIKKTKNYLIINKPAGLLVHSTKNSTEETLSDYLIKKYPKIKSVGEESNRHGIVHRLDKDVSGLMVIALTQKSYLNLKEQFKNRTIGKHYKALICGHLPEKHGTISFPIKRSRKGFKMAAVPKSYKSLENDNENEKLREAISKYKVIKEYTNFSLVDVKIETGRTHQIRVHFLALNTPLAGDKLYFTKNSLKVSKKLNLNRIFLYANELSFLDLKNKKQNFKIETPENLNRKLDLIK